MGTGMKIRNILKTFLLILALQMGTASAADMVSLDFHDVSLQDVVKSIAEITGRNFIIDEKVKGRITIVSPNPVTVEEAYQAFISALSMKKLAVVQVGKNFKIVSTRVGRGQAIPVESGDEGSFGDQLVTRIIPIQYISATEIRSALNRLVSRSGNIVAYGPTNSIIVTDAASNIRRLMKIIQKLDKQGFQESVEVIPLRFAQAEDVSEKLLMIFEKERPQRTRKRSTDVAQGKAVTSIIPDTRTNQLIVTATRKGLERILDLVGELDREVELGIEQGRIHVRYLRHADAEELAELLTALLGGVTSGRKKKGAGATPRVSSKSSSPFADFVSGSKEGDSKKESSTPSRSSSQRSSTEGSGVFESEVRIVADTSTNALVVSASPNDFRSLARVIKQLDVRRPQVFVEALIMEVNIKKLVNVGVSGHGVGAAGSLGLLGATNFGEAGTLGASELKNAGGLAGVKGLLLGALGKSFNIPGTNLTVPAQGGMLNAFQENGAINVLSAPNILTTDNKKAEIHVGQTVQFPKITGVGANDQVMQGIEREKVGLTLAVTPQINEGDEVTMEIEQKIEEVDDFNVSPEKITTSARSAQTTVVAQSGQTIVIGGLIKDRELNAVSKVPLLGDIPLLGYLFRQKSVSKQKINLMIFITPHVIHDPLDMTRVSVKKNNERRRFYKVHGVGENKALYDYDLDKGLNLAPPARPISKRHKRKKRFNYMGTEEERAESSSESELARKRIRTQPALLEEAVTEADEEAPLRGRRKVKRTSSGNPFAEVRPPSSD